MAHSDGDAVVASRRKAIEQGKQVGFRHMKADMGLRASEEHQSWLGVYAYGFPGCLSRLPRTTPSVLRSETGHL